MNRLNAMGDLQELYDDAMGDFSMTDYDSAIGKLKSVLAQDPNHFDAQLALGMAYYRKGEYPLAIVEGHKAEKMNPNEQLVHTNLSLFYMKSGDKKTAEHHGLQARISSWKGNMTAPAAGAATEDDPELRMAQPKPSPVKIPDKFPDMPWKKKPSVNPPGGSEPHSHDHDKPS
jgi:Flp pilus assembly protein TadD